MECKGSETNEGKKSTVDDCYTTCKDKAGMFIFGRPDSVRACASEGCDCHCETSANPDGTCDGQGIEDFNLYKMTDTGRSD